MLLQDLKKSLLQSLLGKYALYIFQMTSLMILARLIAPESFGILATVQVIAMFFQTIGTSGLAPAVVYQEHVPAQMRDGVFSVTALVGIGLGIVFYFLAPVLFEWFDFENGLYHEYGIFFDLVLRLI